MTMEEELDWLCRLRSKIYVYMPKEWLIPMNNALDMAIQALKQEPCEDAVSRTNLLKHFEDRFIELQKAHRKDLQFGINWCINTLLDAPSVTPIHKDRIVQDFADKCRECGRTAITRAENDEILNEALRLLINVTEEDGVTAEQANGMLKLMSFFFYKYHGLKKKPEWVENVEARMEESEEKK